MSVEIETCDNVESMAMRENVQTLQPGKYKFIHQVIDGMTIQINEVNITFRDPAFHASVQVLHFKMVLPFHIFIYVCTKCMVYLCFKHFLLDF